MLDASYLSDLWFFKAAAQRENFAMAAADLNITQGAVSQRIRHLESRLGVALFHRVGRRVVLTDSGRHLLAVCGHSFDSIAYELQRITRDDNSADLVLSCIPSLSMDWLIPRLDHWYESSGGVRLRIRAEIAALTKSMMLAEGIDLVLAYDDCEYADLTVAELGAETLLPVCAPAVRDELAGSADLAGFLSGQNLIHDSQPWPGASASQEWACWLAGIGIENVNADRGDFFNLTHLATQAALHGQGIAMGRRRLVAEYLRTGKLVPLVEQGVASPARYRLLAIGEFAENSPRSRFLDWLRREFVK